MAPSAFHPGDHLDELLDRLNFMGSPAPQWGRQPGHHDVWLRAMLPGSFIGTQRPAETHGPDLDQAAKAMIVLELTAGDNEQAAAIARLAEADA